MTRALIIVDYSNDFVADDGVLTGGEPAQSLDPVITQLMKEFHAQDDFIIVVNDCHTLNDPYHPETQLFPPHNIVGTPGRELYGQVGAYYNQIKDSDNVFYTDKRRYSAFAGTEVDIRLRERGITDIWIVGVATDICVLHTAVDGYNLGYQMTIPADGVASFNPAGHEWALGHFASSLGAQVPESTV